MPPRAAGAIDRGLQNVERPTTLPQERCRMRGRVHRRFAQRAPGRVRINADVCARFHSMPPGPVCLYSGIARRDRMNRGFERRRCLASNLVVGLPIVRVAGDGVP